jgi:adenosylcobinamide-GDP ribazoletransferase
VQIQDILMATVFGLSPMVLLFCYFSMAEVDVGNAVTFVLCMLLPVCVVWFWWRQKIQRWIGGYTGDCLGAMQQMTELAFYLAFVAYFGFINRF